jgi:hypothetical protein
MIAAPLRRTRLTEDGALRFIDADRAVWLGSHAVLWRSDGIQEPLPWGDLSEDAGLTVTEGLVVLWDGAALRVLDHTTLAPLRSLSQQDGLIFCAEPLPGRRLVTWSTLDRVLVWSLTSGEVLARHRHAEVRALCGLGGVDDPLVVALVERVGRRVRLVVTDALTGETLRAYHVGLGHRETLCCAVGVPRPGGLISAISTVRRGRQRTILREHTTGEVRVLGAFVPPSPVGLPRIWSLDLIAPELLACMGRGGEFTLSLRTGHITPRPPPGATTPRGLRLTEDGALIDLHHGGPAQRLFGAQARGEALFDAGDALLALTREGDTVSWWRLHR